MVLNPIELLLVLLLLLAAVLCVVDRGERAPDRMRRRLDMRAHIGGMPDAEFSRYYRVPSKDHFHKLVQLIRPAPAQERRARKSARKTTGGFVEYDLRVSMALRYLAGGSYLDIMYLHGVARGTTYKHIYGTLDTLNKRLPDFTLEDDVRDLERCRQLSRVFAQKTDGCAAALSLPRTQCPANACPCS
jgi:hypothetical protein